MSEGFDNAANGAQWKKKIKPKIRCVDPTMISRDHRNRDIAFLAISTTRNRQKHTDIFTIPMPSRFSESYIPLRISNRLTFRTEMHSRCLPMPSAISLV